MDFGVSSLMILKAIGLFAIAYLSLASVASSFQERRIIQEVPGFGCSTNILPKWLKNAFEVICFRFNFPLEKCL